MSTETKETILSDPQRVYDEVVDLIVSEGMVDRDKVTPDARLYDRPESQSPFHYGPAKAGLIQLSRHLAAELGPHAIRVNALVPVPFPNNPEPGFGARLAARTMLGRLGQPADIAAAVAFLCSPDAAYITGETLNVNGGMYMP